MRIAITVLIVLSSAYVSAQAFDVKIIGRQDNETEYTYVVAGHLSSQSDSSANCNVNDYNVNCNGTTTTNADSTPAHQVSYRVRGATFSLQLPDGRVVVVNCESKFAEHFAGPAGIIGAAANHLWAAYMLSFTAIRRNWNGLSA